MITGDMVEFIYSKEKRKGYVIQDLENGLYLVKGIKPFKYYLIQRKDIKKLGGMERWNIV